MQRLGVVAGVVSAVVAVLVLLVGDNVFGRTVVVVPNDGGAESSLQGPAASNRETQPASRQSEAELGAEHVSVSASSTLGPEKGCGGTCTYSAANVVDSNAATAWSEGVAGDGIGEWIRFEFDSTIALARISITPGWQYPGKDCLLLRNGRPRRVTLTTDEGDTVALDLEGRPGTQRLKADLSARSVTLTIDEVEPGRECNGRAGATDTLISDVAFFVWQ